MVSLMRATRAHGRPGTTVIPPGWGASHAPVPNAARNATGTLRHAPPGDASDDGWDPGTRTTTPTAGTAYAAHISARIQSMVTHRSDSERDAAEELVITASYQVTVAHNLAAVEGDLFTVETCADDPTLVGRVLRADHVVRGSDRFERVLFCNLLDT